MKLGWVLMIGLLLLPPGFVLADYQGAHHIMPYENPPISYGQWEARDPVAKLKERLEAGEVTFQHDPEFGYLPAMLDALGVPRSSQMLVFARTSLHRHLISPEHPRAMFFNDDIYIGWVRWAPLLEISAVDPDKGGVFYVLSQTQDENPRLVRNDSCLECHVSSKTLGVPGHLFRSFDTDMEGLPADGATGDLINHNMPLAERWGGWYVTGKHGRHGHRGNLFGEEAFERDLREPNYRGNLLDLSEFFPPASMPEPTSDIVALMVFGHQVHMHNFITRLSYEATIHLDQYDHVDYLDKPIEAFLRYLLFVDEPALLGRIKGVSGYDDWFQAQGVKDRQGRSLRDLDLYTRLFKYPCSYLIYTEAFDHLPAKLKDRIYRRLWEILSGEDQSPEYQRLSGEDRQAVLEILRDTKPLPDYFRGAAKNVGP